MNQGYKELTINLLQKAPEAGPLLVKLHDKHRLYELAGNREPQASAELADIMADLLKIGVSQSENELITDYLEGLKQYSSSEQSRYDDMSTEDLYKLLLKRGYWIGRDRTELLIKLRDLDAARARTAEFHFGREPEDLADPEPEEDSRQNVVRRLFDDDDAELNRQV